MSEISMLERVARALCDGKWDARDFNETSNGESPEEQREYWREKARAAIEAMREPIPEEIMHINGSANWPQMIDAALTPSTAPSPTET